MVFAKGCLMFALLHSLTPEPPGLPSQTQGPIAPVCVDAATAATSNSIFARGESTRLFSVDFNFDSIFSID